MSYFNGERIEDDFQSQFPKKSNLTKEWSDYNHDYEKKQQDIRIKDGTEYMNCWPNAGKWMVLSDNSAPDIHDADVTHTRLTHSED